MNDFLENIPYLENYLTRSNVIRFCKILRYTLIIISIFLLYLILQLLIKNVILVGGQISKQENLLNKQLKLVKTQANLNLESENKDYSKIANRSPFGNLEEKPESVINNKKVEKKISNLKLELIGTFVSGQASPYSIIEDQKKREQEVFEIGDSVFDVAKLVEIFADRVEIERDGKIEILKLDDLQSAGDSSSSDDSVETLSVDESDVNEALNNLPLLLTQARAVPYFKNGKSVGLRLFAIKRGSLYEKINLKNGDILKEINGNNLGDISQAVKLFEKLKEERSIILKLQRNKVSKTIRYEIE